MSCCLSALHGKAEEAQRSAVSKLLDQVGHEFFSPATEPTDPIEIARIATEWDPAQAIAVNLSISETLANDEVLSFYTDMAKIVARYVPFVIGYDPDEEGSLSRLRERILEKWDHSVSTDRLLFMPTYSRSNWIRDFAPIFAFSTEGGLVAIDPIFRELQPELESFANLPTAFESRQTKRSIGRFASFKRSARKDEAAPLFISRFLRQTLSTDCEISRPPLHLQGGDFITDGQGNVFISEDTLLNNGGIARTVSQIFEAYLGSKTLHMLEAPPGTAAKHLDMTMKFVSADTLLLSLPPPEPAKPSRYTRHLAQKCISIYESNLAYLRRNFPETRIILLPSLPLSDVSEEGFKQMLNLRFIETACKATGIDFDAYIQKAGSRIQGGVMDAEIAAFLKKTIGTETERGSEASYAILSERLLGESIEQLRENYVSSGIVYRSYANSLLLRTNADERVVIIPRYRPRNGESEEQVAAIENAAMEAYRTALPEASLYWLDSDVMSERLGAIHCLTVSLPSQQP